MILPELLKSVDCIFHLAGVKRSENPNDFFDGNVLFTVQLCSAIQSCEALKYLLFIHL